MEDKSYPQLYFTNTLYIFFESLHNPSVSIGK